MMIKRIVTYSSVWVLMLLTLVACSSGDDAKGALNEKKIAVVERKPLVTNLFFSGHINPIRSQTVTSPAEGRVASMQFEFGQKVREGDLLLTVRSNALAEEYRQTVESYLKARNDFDSANSKLAGTNDLWNLGLVAETELDADRSTAATSRIALIKATKALEEVVATLGLLSLEEIKKLTIADEEKVQQILNQNIDALEVRAGISGVVLSASDDEKKNVIVGGELKKGQGVAAIGDLTGISIDIGITEVDLDKIAIGQEAEITGVAFPSTVLRGRVRSINSQASTTSGSAGGLPTFPAVVEVSDLTADQVELIRVGMSAKVRINIEKPGVILIPIDAVYRRSGRSYVKRLIDGKEVETEVTTSETSFNDVVITSGLQEGDRVVYVPQEQVIVDN